MSGEELAAWAGSWRCPRPWSKNFHRRGLQATRMLSVGVQSSQTLSRQRREPVRAGPALPVAPPALSLQTEHRTLPLCALCVSREEDPQGTVAL